MKKVMFEVSDEMFIKIDKAAAKEGFMSRSEFLRFLLVTYFKTSENTFKESEKVDSTPGDVSDELDLEFGIPVNVIRKIEAVAKKMG